MNDRALLAGRLDAAGLDGKAILKTADEPAYGERLEKNTALAAERGVFGSPTFIVGDDLFFGNDRLGFLEERLRPLGRAATSEGASDEGESSRRVGHRRRSRHRSGDRPPFRPRRLLGRDARPEPGETERVRARDRALARLSLRRDRRSAARRHDRASARGASARRRSSSTTPWAALSARSSRSSPRC